MNFDPTPEQLDAKEKFQTGKALKINAFAGAGKTSTLKLLGNSTTRRGLYLAFNKSIASDAQKQFPSTVTCQTTHSLAYRSTPSPFKKMDGKMANRFYGNQIAQALNLSSFILQNERFSLDPKRQGYLISETIKRFCQSADEKLSITHMPHYARFNLLSDEALTQIQAMILGHAKLVWGRMINPNDSTPLGHDGYLKLWALSNPKIPAEFILMDEAQDTNPVVLGVLNRQDSQVIYVGDRHQQIYEWRGAVNAMDRVNAPLNSYLTRSFRFGPEIAEAATKIIQTLGETRSIEGNPSIKSFIGSSNPKAILSRTNAQVIANVIACQGSGQKVHIVGGSSELLRLLEGVESLQRGEPSDLTEFFGFNTWIDVVEFSKTEEGSHLKTFVNLVEKTGLTQLQKSLRNTAHLEEQADVVVSTAHKAKGREWEDVKLSGDFAESKFDTDGKELKPDEAEVRLFYVAATRGKVSVDIDPELCESFGIRPNPKPEQAKSLFKNVTSQSSNNYQEPQSTKRKNSESPVPPRSDIQKSSACFIATAVYGSEDAPEVVALRKFRDERLHNSMLGRAFISLYYTISPPIARRLQRNSSLAVALRWLLNKLVWRIRNRSFE